MDEDQLVKKTIKIMFEDFWRPPKIEYIKRNALYKLLSKYYDLEISNDPDFLLYSSFGYEHLKYSCLRIFYTGENVRPNFNECDYAFSFDFPISERNYRLPIYRLYPSYSKLFQPRDPQKVPSENRKFCCFLASNPNGKERNEFFQLLSTYKKVDSGGKVFLNIDQCIPRGEELEWMSQYKFCIAFENSSHPGYTTEKLINALVANTIPIYWGNPIVERDFNPKAFINFHEFPDSSAVIDRIIQIDKDIELYKSLLTEPFLPGGKEIDSCKEDNIIASFDKIFTNEINYIPKFSKKRQTFKYPFLKSKRHLLACLNKLENRELNH